LSIENIEWSFAMAAQNQPAKDDQVQSEGRKGNAARPLNDAPANAGAERYPATSKDDGVESPPAPRQGAGDGGPKS
jgi:hypothetical protein